MAQTKKCFFAGIWFALAFAPLSVGAETPLQHLFIAVTHVSVFYPDVAATRAVFRKPPAADGADDAFDTDLFSDQFETDAVPPNIAEQLLESMDNRADGGIVEGSGSDEPVPESFTDSAGRLRRFTYGAEQFSVQERDGKKTVVDSAEGLIVRRTLDGGNHLLRQERFKVGASSRDLTLLSATAYAYHDGEKLPYQTTEDITDGARYVVTDYDENGFAVIRETSHYEYPDKNDKKHQDDPPRLVQDKKQVWAYDDAKRLVAEETTTYLHTKTATGKEKGETTVIKKLYAYDKAGVEKPDVSYFENGELRIHTVYESENVYNETMYFDGGFSVQARYEGGVKVMEIILLQGKEMRRRTFEN